MRRLSGELSDDYGDNNFKLFESSIESISIVRHSVVPSSPGPSNTVKLTISNKLLRPLKKSMKQHLKETSSSDDSENEKLEMSNSSSEDETNETSQNNDENDVSFTNMLNTSKLIKKSDMLPRKHAININDELPNADPAIVIPEEAFQAIPVANNPNNNSIARRNAYINSIFNVQ
ncbi:hypothetical protein FQR65_LT10036 [Abscondita terminalis]|nr:hypothetical protein FQR65_LT10036 [Abscondita terminalis]